MCRFSAQKSNRLFPCAQSAGVIISTVVLFDTALGALAYILYGECQTWWSGWLKGKFSVDFLNRSLLKNLQYCHTQCKCRSGRQYSTRVYPTILYIPLKMPLHWSNIYSCKALCGLLDHGQAGFTYKIWLYSLMYNYEAWFSILWDHMKMWSETVVLNSSPQVSPTGPGLGICFRSKGSSKYQATNIELKQLRKVKEMEEHEDWRLWTTGLTHSSIEFLQSTVLGMCVCQPCASPVWLDHGA